MQKRKLNKPLFILGVIIVCAIAVFLRVVVFKESGTYNAPISIGVVALVTGLYYACSKNTDKDD